MLIHNGLESIKDPAVYTKQVQECLDHAREIVKHNVNSTHEMRLHVSTQLAKMYCLNPETSHYDGNLDGVWNLQQINEEVEWSLDSLQNLSPVNYEMTSISRRKKPTVVHVEQLKPYADKCDEDSTAPRTFSVLEIDQPTEDVESCLPTLFGSCSENLLSHSSSKETQALRPLNETMSSLELRNLEMDGKISIDDSEGRETESDDRPRRIKRKPQRLILVGSIMQISLFLQTCHITIGNSPWNALVTPVADLEVDWIPTILNSHQLASS